MSAFVTFLSLLFILKSKVGLKEPLKEAIIDGSFAIQSITRLFAFQVGVWNLSRISKEVYKRKATFWNKKRKWKYFYNKSNNSRQHIMEKNQKAYSFTSKHIVYCCWSLPHYVKVQDEWCTLQRSKHFTTGHISIFLAGY